MIHQTERTGQDLGSVDFPFLVYKDKSQSSTRKKIERTKECSLRYSDTLGLDYPDPDILPFPQEWEEVNYIKKPKEHFIQQQNRNRKVGSILEYHLKGGTGVNLKRSTVQPLEYHTQLPNQIRGDRTQSKGFSKKSRRNIQKKLSFIGQDLIPSNRVKLITLTYDGREHFEKKYTPKDCKKHLNSFLTRIRKHLKGRVDKWFYMWKCEPSVKRYLRLGGNPVLHFHLTLFNVDYIDQNWVRETWSRIVTGWGDFDKQPKDLVRTKTETPRNWNNTEHYINKFLCYVSKEDVVETKYKDYIRKKRLDPRKSLGKLKKLQNMNYGRVWGIGRYDDYNHFVVRKRVKLTLQDESKLMRVLMRHYKSNLMKYQGENFSHKKWKEFEKYYRTGRITKNYKTCVIHIEQQFHQFTTNLGGEKIEELLHLLEIPIKECKDEVKSDVVVDYTPNDYIKYFQDDKVVGL